MATKKVTVPKKSVSVKEPVKAEAPGLSGAALLNLVLLELAKSVREIASDPSNKLVNVVADMDRLLDLL